MRPYLFFINSKKHFSESITVVFHSKYHKLSDFKVNLTRHEPIIM